LPRQGLKALVTGSISALGSNYVIQLKALEADSRGILALEQAQANSKEEIISQLGLATVKLRRKLGESLSSIQKFDVPLEQATTSSLEALKAFSMGSQEMRRGGIQESIVFFRRAIELDPHFASAYSYLGTQLMNANKPAGIKELFQKAYDLRERLTEGEKLNVISRYYGSVLGDTQKWLECQELRKRLYPNDVSAYINICSYYNGRRQYEKALEIGREAQRVDPSHAYPYYHLAIAQIGLNRFEEARQTIQQALARKLDSPGYHKYLYQIAFINGDSAIMQQQIDWARGRPEELEALQSQAWTAEFGGKGRQAEDFYRQAIALARHNNLKSRESGLTAEMAATDALFGNCRQALDGVEHALSLSRAASYNKGFVLALCGEPDQALALAEEFIKANPKSDWISGWLAPVIRAMAELRRGKPDQAIQLLRPSSPYERQSGFVVNNVRGQAYLGLRAGKEAAVEFQEILDHRGYGPNSLYWALAHLGSARAAALMGDTAKSRKMYEAFLQLWKDADPDIPILIEAKAEYAKLR
jgi:tetratricopeptide (TPR) repeat protein